MKIILALPFVLSALSWLGAVNGASAQSYAIDRFTIAGGGVTFATGGPYSLGGTLGQPAVGISTGGSYQLAGGFWSIVAVQTPGGPLLTVERQGAGVRVFWPLPGTGFVLDQSPTVTGVWSQATSSYATNATDISITVPAPTGNKFFRLRKQ